MISLKKKKKEKLTARKKEVEESPVWVTASRCGHNHK